MPDYNPKLVRALAGHLYDVAYRMAERYTVIGAVLGAIIGGYLVLHEGSVWGVAPFFSALFGATGWVIGRNKACLLRLHAQVALGLAAGKGEGETSVPASETGDKKPPKAE